MGISGVDARVQALERTEAVLPVIANHAAWAEQNGRLHDEALASLREAGVARLYLPEGLDGWEVDPLTCALVCGKLAAVDTAAAWHVMVFNAARLMAGTWSDELVERIWGDDPDRLVAASGNTPYEGQREGDSYIVSGQNSFVSGCHHASYIMSPMVSEGQMFMVLLPAEECEIVDNWDTLGMRGTGSNDVRAESVRVPVELAAPMFGNDLQAPRNRYYTGRLYDCPSRVVFATYVPVALNLAERALEELKLLAGSKVPYASDKKLARRYLAQQHYGEALGLWRSAKLMFEDALERVWEQAGRGEPFTVEQKADLYLAGTHAMQASGRAVKHVIDAAGSSSLYRGMPLERIHRDMETLRHHGFANEGRYASVTQALWEVELDYPLLLR